MRYQIPLIVLLLSQPSVAANRIPIAKLLDHMIHRSTLVEPGSKPFYMKATISEKANDKSEFNGAVEEYWLSPTKWRREIRLRDFSQTRIVNGEMVSEQNNGDYLPVHDEMLANEIVDPLTQTAVDLLNRLNMTAAEPGSGHGQCMAEQYFNDAEGAERRALLAYDCDTGLLFYLYSPECCYGVMTDYRKFHGKMIAFATKDDPINIQIDTLRELENVDESLFVISQTTPPEKRITTIQMSAPKLRALALNQPEMAWPPLEKKPEGTGVDVQIVIGRDGHVKDAWCYTNAGDAVKAAALSNARKWTFTPQNVEGVPAQVESDILFPFPAAMKAAASGPVVSSIFDRIRQAVDIRLEGSPAFHLKTSFHSEDGGAKGTYEETWVSPRKWRREVALNDIVVVEVSREGTFYRTFPGKYAPRLADDILDALSFNLPGDNGADFHEPDWTAIDAKLFNLSTLRLSQGYINPRAGRMPSRRCTSSRRRPDWFAAAFIT
jgi:hypothetical protein